jgi:hypothetical protein
MFGQVPPFAQRARGGGAAQRNLRSVAHERLQFVVFAIVAVFGCTGAAGPRCSSEPGGRIMLASDAVDPDVFLWDSRERLIDYTGGDWGNTRQIFTHTLLTEPGTLALVVACIPRAAHPRYAVGEDEDAVGVRLTSGPNRGRYGWILSSDAHAQRTPAGQSASATHSHPN